MHDDDNRIDLTNFKLDPQLSEAELVDKWVQFIEILIRIDREYPDAGILPMRKGDPDA